MSSQQTMVFQRAIDVVEELPEYQQEDLVEIIQHRLVEHRRDLLAENIKEARREYTGGEVKKGTVSDLMRELYIKYPKFQTLSGKLSWSH